MKIIFRFSRLLPLGIALILVASCKKYELVPSDQIQQNDVYDPTDKNGALLQQRVNNLYSLIPMGFNRIDNLPLDAATDDAIATAPYQAVEKLSKSGITAEINPDDYWSNGYAAIRNVNNYLAYESVVPLQASGLQAQFRAEARFIRALQYFELIKRYGGVPLIGDKIFGIEDKIDLERSSYGDCVNYIISECDAIKDNFSNGLTNNLGRVTKGADLALKARVLLYAASPINNPNNDMDKWIAASNAAKAVVDMTNIYGLEASFNTSFINRTSKEIIFAYQTGNNATLEILNAPIGYGLPNTSMGLVSPTQELVDAFPMITGKGINDAGTTFDPSNPYLNRDPRLTATVFFNGAMWLNRPVETFDGGKDKPLNARAATRTGYYERKFLGNFESSNSYTSQARTFPIFRYAGLKLDYAEALNETLALPDAEVYKQLVDIRKRAGIQAGTGLGLNLYGLKPAMTKTEMREAIRLERRIEMAFEEQRFWDIRRWKLAESVGNATVHGVRVIRNSDNTFAYQQSIVDRLTFDASKNYLYPLPFSEVSVSKSIKQNIGY